MLYIYLIHTKIFVYKKQLFTEKNVTQEKRHIIIF